MDIYGERGRVGKIQKLRLICINYYVSNRSSLMVQKASLTAQLIKNPFAMQETLFNSWVSKICWRRDRLSTPVLLDFFCGSTGKESTCNVGDLSSIPGLGKSPREGEGYPLQYSGLENSMDCIVHWVVKSRTLLSDFYFHFLVFQR